MPNIEALRYLIELSRTNSINIAANNLYVSKSTISMAIKKLEQELGVVLLTRTHRGVLLTEDGQKVLALAEQIMALLNDINRISNKEHTLSVPQCTHIYALEDMLTTSLPSLLKVFSTIFGAENFSLHSAISMENLLAEIAQNADHIGFFLSTQLSQSDFAKYPQLQHRYLGHSYIHLITAQNSQYLTGSHPAVYTLADIFQMPLISRYNDTFITTLIEQYHYPAPMVAFTAPNNATYWQAIADDLGVGFCAQNINKFHFRARNDLSTFPLKEKIPLCIYLISHQGYPNNVLEHLIQALS